jgi:hypothetical protein
VADHSTCIGWRQALELLVVPEVQQGIECSIGNDATREWIPQDEVDTSLSQVHERSD